MRISDWSSDVCSSDLLKENPGLAERAAVTGSLHNLLTYPWISERVEQGTLALHGWWFDLETGDLWRTEPGSRSEEHTSELQSLMRISYAVFCLKKKINNHRNISIHQ